MREVSLREGEHLWNQPPPSLTALGILLEVACLCEVAHLHFGHPEPQTPALWDSEAVGSQGWPATTLS